jgi:hypothetical protein
LAKIAEMGEDNMNEEEYYATELTDAEIDALADAGEFYLDESGFFLMPTQKEMQKLAHMGETLLFIDNSRS